MPSTETECQAIASKTAEGWQYPNCVGYCDGKYIRLVHPKDSGCNFFNYKSFFSIVLLALLDYDYKFITTWTLDARDVLAMVVFIVTHHDVKLYLMELSTNQDLNHSQLCMKSTFQETVKPKSFYLYL